MSIKEEIEVVGIVCSGDINEAIQLIRATMSIHSINKTNLISINKKFNVYHIFYWKEVD